MSNRQKLGRGKKRISPFRNAKRKGPKVNASGLISSVTAPNDEKELLKEVPAKVDDTVVGKALLYDDGSVDLILDPDAPQWALDKIQATGQEFGYTMETGD